MRSPRCAASSRSSRVLPPARRTATRGCAKRLPRCCCTSGPGLGNGLANLHNARRSHAPVVTIIGDHATYHKQFDAPLAVRHRHRGPQRLAVDPAQRPSRGCGCGRRRCGRRRMRSAGADRDPDPSRRRLVVRGWRRWRRRSRRRHARRCAPRTLEEVAARRFARATTLRSSSVASVLRERGARAPLRRIAAATGAELLAETFPARAERGAGIPRDPAPRLPRRDGRRSARWAPSSHPGRHHVTGLLLRVSGQAE